MYALDRLARSELDIVDALLLGQAALGDHQILTFDRKLSKMIDRAFCRVIQRERFLRRSGPRMGP